MNTKAKNEALLNQWEKQQNAATTLVIQTAKAMMSIINSKTDLRGFSAVDIRTYGFDLYYKDEKVLDVFFASDDNDAKISLAVRYISEPDDCPTENQLTAISAVYPLLPELYAKAQENAAVLAVLNKELNALNEQIDD